MILQGTAARDVVRASIRDGSARLAAVGAPSPQADAHALAAYALGVDRLVIALIDSVPETFADTYHALIRRREAREPLQHIVGVAPFRHLLLRTRRGAFIPRPETEVVAQAAIDAARGIRSEPPVVWDLCTGPGTIALAVASEVPTATVFALERDEIPWQLAAEHVQEFGLPNVRVDRGDVTDGAATAPWPDPHIVVSNPPYIPAGAIPREVEVAKFDPPAALFGGGEDGLVIPTSVISLAAARLRSGGTLVMEHAETQGRATREIALAAGRFQDIRTMQDLTGRDRYLVATIPGKQQD